MKFEYYVSSGIPYLFRTNIETAGISNHFDISLDYRAGVVSNAFRGGIIFNNSYVLDGITIGFGLEKGSMETLTHSITLPYEWQGLALDISLRRMFKCCKSRVGWYLSGTIIAENRRYYETGGTFTKQESLLSPTLSAGMVLRVF